MTPEALDFFTLQRDDELPTFGLSASADDARAYLEATGEPPDRWIEALPPLALGAWLLGGLMERLPLPAGALHGGQEFEFLRAVAPGEPLEGRVRVAQRSERRGTLILGLELELLAGGEPALRGRSTVMAPLPREASEEDATAEATP